jgi:intracellular septation protein
MNAVVKFCTEMGPLAVFFAVYKFYGLIPATAALVFSTLIALAVTFYYERKLPILPLVSAIILSIMGAITIFSGNPIFLKIKPTIVNTLFAAILLGGVYYRKGLLQYVMGQAIPLTEEGWLKFSFRFAMLFLGLACLNEIIWRNFSEAFWVQFKVFGMFPLTILFMLTHIPFLKKYQIREEPIDPR